MKELKLSNIELDDIDPNYFDGKVIEQTKEEGRKYFEGHAWTTAFKYSKMKNWAASLPLESYHLNPKDKAIEMLKEQIETAKERKEKVVFRLVRVSD